MKKLFVFILPILVIFTMTFIYNEYSKRSRAFSTPEIALTNLTEDKYKVREIISTEYFDNKTAAYIFYYADYAEPNYLEIAKFIKKEYGWENDGVFAIGNLSSSIGDSMGSSGTLLRFSNNQTEHFNVSEESVAIVPLENEMSIHLFHGLSPEEQSNIQSLPIDTDYQAIKQSAWTFIKEKGWDEHIKGDWKTAAVILTNTQNAQLLTGRGRTR
jgi:hypothetical protein